MFEPDEFIFAKVAKFLKHRKKSAREAIAHTVKLCEIKPRLTLVARAVTGHPIEIFEAEQEGGYKNNAFFLPERFAGFDTSEKNLAFYIFRTLYLSIQKSFQLNYELGEEHTLEEARKISEENSEKVLKEIFSQFPGTETIYTELKLLFEENTSEKNPPDYSFIYGKWMENSPETVKKKVLQNISEKIKTAIEEEINTILKANAVEEIKSIEVDKKAQEDYVLTHNFEKAETAEEWEGGWRDFDGDDELNDHANALEDLNMKQTVRVDDPTHSIYQAEFIENTTISESAELETTGHHILYDEWDYSKRTYKSDFCKVFPQTQTETDFDYYKNTLREQLPL